MRHPEALFATTAALLPTLFIAVVVEINLLLARLETTRERIKTADLSSPQNQMFLDQAGQDWSKAERFLRSCANGIVDQEERSAKRTLATSAALFLMGELAAVSFLTFDMPAEFVTFLAFAVLPLIVALTIITVWVPFRRLRSQRDITSIVEDQVLKERQPVLRIQRLTMIHYRLRGMLGLGPPRREREAMRQAALDLPDRPSD